MKYLIKRSVLTETSEIEISSEEYLKLKEARGILFTAMSIEETYDILIDNYSEFENELMKIALDSMLYNSAGYGDFHKINSRLNKRLINFLTTARLYVEHIKQDVDAIIPSPEIGKNKVNEFFSEKYENNIEYRFMEELRNYVQHCGLPIHSSFQRHGLKDYKEISKGIVHSVDLYSEKSFLRIDNKFKNKILSEIGEKIDLKFSVRKYVECFSDIHDSIRKIVANKISDSRNLIELYINRYKNEIQVKTLGLTVFKFDEIGNVLEEFPLLLEWDDIRILLEKKNRYLKNLSLSYVTGKIKEK